MESSINQYNPELIRIVQKRILGDNELQCLQEKKAEIYSRAMPIVTMKNGVLDTIRIDEVTHPILKEIDELINLRVNQIINIYHITYVKRYFK